MASPSAATDTATRADAAPTGLGALSREQLVDLIARAALLVMSLEAEAERLRSRGESRPRRV